MSSVSFSVDAPTMRLDERLLVDDETEDLSVGRCIYDDDDDGEKADASLDRRRIAARVETIMIDV